MIRKLPKKSLYAIIIATTIIFASITGYFYYKSKYADPGPIREPNNWTLIMQDEFNGNVLNESIWTKGYPPSEYNCFGQCHNHQGWQAPENVIIENGLLRIKGENTTHSDAPFEHFWGDKNLPLNYTTGAITSWGKFGFKYGYLEARQKMPQGPTGFWPAFWTIQYSTPEYGEIDVQEWLSGETNEYYTALHTRHEGIEDLTSKGKSHSELPNLTSDFHIYGVEWHPDHISFYFDNKEVRRIIDKSQISALKEQHIRINLAIGGWASAPDEKTIWPAWYEIDWVRVWQYNEYL